MLTSPKSGDGLSIALYFKLIRFLVFGLVLYIADTTLHLSIASKFMDMRDCHKSFRHVFENFTPSVIADETGDSELPPLLRDKIYIKLREVSVKALPVHWGQRVLEIGKFQIKDAAPLIETCKFNEKTYKSFMDLGMEVCKKAIKGDSRTNVIKDFWEDNVSDEEEFLQVLGSIGNTEEKSNKSTLIRLSETNTAVSLNLSAGLTALDKIFNIYTKEEMDKVKGFVAEKGERLPGLLTSLSTKVESKDIEKIVKAFQKIESKNFPKIQELLKLLEVSLTDLITDTSLFFKFFRDPEKSAVLVKIQKLLPDFVPSEVNSVLKIKKAVEDTPGMNDLIQDMFRQFPPEFFVKILGANLSKDDEAGLKNLLNFGISEKSRISIIIQFVVDKNLLDVQGRKDFLSDCHQDRFSVECINKRTDLCPNGHVFYGSITYGVMALPGLLCGLSEFLHYKYFRFDGIASFGMNFPWFIKLLCLPLYLLIMIPLFFIICNWTYIKIITNIILEILGKEPYENFKDAVGLHVNLESLEGLSESFLQILVQSYFLFILVFFGVGTVVAGVSAADFFQNIFPTAVASITISVISLLKFYWGFYEYDRKRKNFFLEESLYVKIVHQFTGFSWFAVSIFVKIFSILGLCLLTWVECLSESLTETGENGLDFPRVLPLLLVSIIPLALNSFLHIWFIGEESPFSIAHGILSAVFPSRFLHPDDNLRTKKFLFFNQLTDWSSHILAWFVYSLTMYSYNGDDFALYNLFLPMVALISVGPSLGIVHWSTSLRNLYISERDDTIPKKPVTDSRKRAFYIFWRGFVSISRSASLILLLYVFYEHYGEVLVANSFRLGLWQLLPYLGILIFSNTGFHLFMIRGSSGLRAFYSFLLPNDFRKVQKLKARTYLLVNTIYNGVIWALIWLFMTFYCWECTKILSISKLIPIFPTITVLWILQWALTIFVWKFVIEPNYGTDDGTQDSWPSKVYSMTTAL